jgi:Phage Mu protein F like protein
MAGKPTLDEIRATFAFGTPFKAQLDFLRAKLDLPTERWDDIMLAAHDRAFIVAGVAKADLLSDLHQAVIDSSAKGTGLGAFRTSFRATVARHGWTGWTGEGSPAGEAWRTRVIYQANLATSYAAGRYQQLSTPASITAMPYWEYIHSDSVAHPRPAHAAWHGVTLLRTDPWWRTHSAPNGWGCMCRVRGRRKPLPGAITQRPDGWDTIDPQTGSPPGIDRGFGYQPGANRLAPLREMVDAKLITYPPAIAKALAADLGKMEIKA